MPQVASTNVAAVDWNRETHRMTVEFRNGARYEYDDIDGDAYASVLGAESVGRRLREVAAGHPYRKIG